MHHRLRVFELAANLGMPVAECIAMCKAGGWPVISGLDYVPAEASDVVRRQREMGRGTREFLPGQLSATSDELDAWIDTGAELWIDAGWRTGISRPLFRYLQSSGRQWAVNATLDLGAPTDGVDEWLDEILARAELLGPHVRIASDWPAWFAGDTIDVIIWVDGVDLRGWVGRAEGVPVGVSLRTWDLLGTQGSRRRRSRPRAHHQLVPGLWAQIRRASALRPRWTR